MLRTARRMELLHERTSARERGGALFDFVWISSLLILFFSGFHSSVTRKLRVENAIVFVSFCRQIAISLERSLEISLGKVMEMFEGGVLAVACDK